MASIAYPRQKFYDSFRQTQHSQHTLTGNYVDLRRQELQVDDIFAFKGQSTISNRTVWNDSGSELSETAHGQSSAEIQRQNTLPTSLADLVWTTYPEGRLTFPSSSSTSSLSDSGSEVASETADYKQGGYYNVLDFHSGTEVPSGQRPERSTIFQDSGPEELVSHRKKIGSEAESTQAQRRRARHQELAFTDGQDPGPHKPSSLSGIVKFEEELASSLVEPLVDIYGEISYDKDLEFLEHASTTSLRSRAGSIEDSIKGENYNALGYGESNAEKLQPGVETNQAIPQRLVYNNTAIEYDPPGPTLSNSSVSSRDSAASGDSRWSRNSTAPTDPGTKSYENLQQIASGSEPRLADRGPSPSPIKPGHNSSLGGSKNKLQYVEQPKASRGSSQFHHIRSPDTITRGREKDPSTSTTSVESVLKAFNTLNDMRIESPESADKFQELTKFFRHNIPKVTPRDLQRIIPPQDRPGSSQNRDSEVDPPDDLPEADSRNWRDIRRKLPNVYRFAIFANDVWTLDTTYISPNIIKNLPIRIAQRPVILNYLHPLIGSFPYRADPAANRLIDPKKGLDDDTLQLLFRTYPGAKAACVLLNKTLLILHDGKLNRKTELRKSPRCFGGLSVDYVISRMNYTSGSNYLRHSRGLDRASNRTRRPPIADVGSKFRITYLPSLNNGDQSYDIADPGGVSAGLRLRHKSKDIDVLTIPLHSLLNGPSDLFEELPNEIRRGRENPWSNPGRFMDQNKENFTFSYLNRDFGKLHQHFEPNQNAPGPRQDGDPRDLLHDIALVEANPGQSSNMPFLIFRGPDKSLIEMEWADPDEEDFISQEIFLLGFVRNPESRFGRLARVGKYKPTASESGAIVLSPADFKDGDDDEPSVTESGVFPIQASGRGFLSPTTPGYEGESSSATSAYNDAMDLDQSSGNNASSEDTSNTDLNPTIEYPVTVIGSMYAPLGKNDRLRTRKYFQRSYLWRSDFRINSERKPTWIREHGQDPNGFTSINGASGCPLATKIQRDGKTVYRIFGFQNSELSNSLLDDPELPSQDWPDGAISGVFKTYQSLRLPKALLSDWDIVWDPDTPSSQRSSRRAAGRRRLRSLTERISRQAVS